MRQNVPLAVAACSLLAFMAVPSQSAPKVPQKAPTKPRPAAPSRPAPAVKPEAAPEEPREPYRDDVPSHTGIDLDALVRETQKSSADPSRMTLVWWVPEEFWRASFASNKELTEGQREEFYAVMRPYTMLIIVDGRLEEAGRATYRPEASIRSDLRIRALDGTELRPYAGTQIGDAAKGVIEIARPILSNLLGPLGQNMHVYFFAAQTAAGKPVTGARASGPFSVMLGNREYRWRLPLSTVLPAKKCPTCSETFAGTYQFCPYDGTKMPDPAN